MKKITQKTAELAEMVAKTTEERRAFYAARPNRWQESQPGREFEEQTDLLSGMLNQLNDWLYELTEIK